MKVTLDLSAEERLEAERDLYDAARQERDAVRSVQLTGACLAAAAGILLLALAVLAVFWPDRLTGGERTLARVLLAVAAATLLVGAVLAGAAAWPLRGRSFDELRVAVREPRDDRERERARRLAYNAVEAVQAERLRRAASLRWGLGLFLAGLALVAVQAVAFAFTGGDDDPAPPPVQPPASAPASRPGWLTELATAYAPQLMLSGSEHYGPIDPARYLASARLRWLRPKVDPLVLKGPRLLAAIGADCGDRCAAFGAYGVDQLTRPFRSGRNRPQNLQRDQGFYLDGSSLMKPGQLVPNPHVPLFYEGDASRITYWAFFAFAQRVRVKGAARGREGDWEAVTVTFERGQPSEVRLDRRGPTRVVAWETMKLAGGTHPKLYVTARSHELATRARSLGQRGARPCASPGRGCVRRVRDPGLVWRPSLAKLEDQPWYGFGGAWGEPGKGSRTTGDLGPSRYRARP